jgi:hypothetical protein
LHGLAEVEHLLCRGIGLVEVIDFRGVLCRMSELKGQALAMSGGWETGSFDHQHFVGHVAVRGIIGDRVNAGFRHDITRFVGLRHDRLLSKIDYFPVGVPENLVTFCHPTAEPLRERTGFDGNLEAYQNEETVRSVSVMEDRRFVPVIVKPRPHLGHLCREIVIGRTDFDHVHFQHSFFVDQNRTCDRFLRVSVST